VEAKSLQLFSCGLNAGPIVTPIQVCADRQVRLRARGPDKPEDFLIAVQGLSRPILGDFGKEAMLDGIPLGRAGGIVRHRDGEAERVHELGLEFGLPGPTPTAIAAAGIAEEQQAASPSVPAAAVGVPPAGNGASGEGRRIVRDAHGHAAAIGEQIVNAVRNGHADRIRAKVVVVDQAGRAIPACAWVLERADEFALFGIHAENGPSLPLEAIAQLANVEKLLVAIRARIGGELFLVHAERIPHAIEQPGDGVGTDRDPEVAEGQRDFAGGAAGPFHAGDGIAAGVVFQQVLDERYEVGGFFSTGMRPPPTRRVRASATS